LPPAEKKSVLSQYVKELFLLSIRLKRIGKIFSFYSFYSFEILLGRLRREIIQNWFQNYSKFFLFNFVSNSVQFPRVSVLLFILFILTELFFVLF